MQFHVFCTASLINYSPLFLLFKNKVYFKKIFYNEPRDYTDFHLPRFVQNSTVTLNNYKLLNISENLMDGNPEINKTIISNLFIFWKVFSLGTVFKPTYRRIFPREVCLLIAYMGRI